MLPNAEIYVYELNDKIKAFIGIDNGYIAGTLVSYEMQSLGIGKKLLDRIKEIYSKLSLAVYKNNTKAVSFYQRDNS